MERLGDHHVGVRRCRDLAEREGERERDGRWHDFLMNCVIILLLCNQTRQKDRRVA